MEQKIHRIKLTNFVKLLTIHQHPCHLQPKIINTSFYALVSLLLAKRERYFNVSRDTNIFFAIQSNTSNISDNASLN